MKNCACNLTGGCEECTLKEWQPASILDVNKHLPDEVDEEKMNAFYDKQRNKHTPERSVEETAKKFNNDMAFQLNPTNDTIKAVRLAHKMVTELLQSERQKRDEVVEAVRAMKVPLPPEFMTAREARGYNQAVDDILQALT